MRAYVLCMRAVRAYIDSAWLSIAFLYGRALETRTGPSKRT